MAGTPSREDAMKVISCCVMIIHIVAGEAHAQTFNDLQIRLGAFTLSSDGGEKPLGVWFSTGSVVIGKTAISTFSFGNTCEAFAVSSDGSLREDATTAWKIELTPVRVVADAVTFRLRWVRVAALRQQLNQLPMDAGKTLGVPTDDIQLTLRPGESWPMDTVSVPAGARTVDGRPCGSTSSIRASVDNYPWEDDDRRLVVADLWLVERLSSGTEVPRSQPLSVRGLPNRPVRFYFDSIVVDGSVTLDIYGILVSRLETGSLALSVETRSRWAPGSPNFSGPQRSVKSEIQVKPAETVEIRLPILGDDAGPVAKRAFSIRIRARQLR
jgi:hypothetical protein